MKNSFYLLTCTTILFAACGNETEKAPAEAVTTPPAVEMTEVTGSPAYDSAAISLGEVTTTPTGDSVSVIFNFNVKNYDLKSQTADADSKMCNNSDQGQHIHFILDNNPYAALYEPTHKVTLPKNSEHYLMAFLSRSYHESIKSKGAAMVYHFKVDEKGKIQKLEDPTTPMLFYSRPKGDYVGEKNTANLLFDFYLWNTAIGADSNRVMAHVKGDGVDTTMVFTDWKPYFLHHIPMGKPAITLKLTDKGGNKIDGPMTEITREFGLAADEPLAQ